MPRARNQDLKCYGLGKVTDTGQITVPADARDDMGIEPKDRVMVFGDPGTCQLIVVPAPPADKLLDFASKHAPHQSKGS